MGNAVGQSRGDMWRIWDNFYASVCLRVKFKTGRLSIRQHRQRPTNNAADRSVSRSTPSTPPPFQTYYTADGAICVSLGGPHRLPTRMPLRIIKTVDWPHDRPTVVDTDLESTPWKQASLCSLIIDCVLICFGQVI